LTLIRLYIDKDVIDYPQVASIRSRINLPAIIVEDVRQVYKKISSSPDPVQAGKETLLLTKNMGAFIRDCPGTSYYKCCGYKILHIGTFCIMDCSYCILQSYFHPPILQFFVNHRDMMAELDLTLSEKKINRIGTGEFTDSMIWELWTNLSNTLVSRFSTQANSVLELKTKTTAVGNLKNLQHNKKTIISWSLNTEKIIYSEERNTSSLSARLKAARKCESWGYPLAFHFDPMFIYDGCENDYKQVVKQLFSHVSPENIVWISLGTFRFMPSLKPLIQQRFSDSKIVYGEFIPGIDGKMRYFKPLRIALYKKMVRWIKDIAPDVVIYFCMEDDEVWEKSLCFIPSEPDGISDMLDKSAAKHCNLISC